MNGKDPAPLNKALVQCAEPVERVAE